MLSEAYNKMQKPKQEVVEEGILGALAGGLLGNVLAGASGGNAIVGGLAGSYLGYKAGDEESDKTGKDSDRGLLDEVERDGTAGPELLSRARAELDEHGSISPETRDALARDEDAPWAQDDDPGAKDHNTEVVKEGLLGALAGGLLGHTIIGSIPGAALLGGAIPAALNAPIGAAAGGYIGHKMSDEEEPENIFDWHGLLDQLHEELETAFNNEIPKEEVAELFATHALGTWVDNGAFAVEDQETGYEAHMDELGAEHGYTGALKGHATD